jgi:hypothetical protein
VSDALVLVVVLLLAASGYAAGRMHGQVGYRGGYRAGYRQGHADASRSRPMALATDPSPVPTVGGQPVLSFQVTGGGDHDGSESRQQDVLTGPGSHRMRHPKG